MRDRAQIGRLLTLAAALHLTAAFQARCGQGPETIRIPVRLVNAPTLVFSKTGQLMQGLEAADFRLADNQIAQKIRLDTNFTPPAVAIAVQANSDVQEYAKFIDRVGSVVDSLLLGESGTAAVLTYGDSVAAIKPFGQGDVREALRKISANDRAARMFDAGVEAISLLKEQEPSRKRVLLFIGQPFDKGSSADLETLKKRAEEEDVAIYCLTLPVLGKKFVSDTFSARGAGAEGRGGFVASVELTKLIPALNRASKAGSGADPFSQLVENTGGTQIHFRKQRELEDAITVIGKELRTTYMLSYSPGSDQPGYHRITVSVDVPGARTYTRPGYWRR